jgi:predicted  nucleic acid-binding Zn-ribbon protein
VTAQHHLPLDPTAREAELADLRTRLDRAHSQIVGAATSAAHYARLDDELRTIRALLDEPEPAAAEIRSRWLAVLDSAEVLGTSAAASAITAAVRSLFGPG